MSIMKEFKTFAIQSNVMDMAANKLGTMSEEKKGW